MGGHAVSERLVDRERSSVGDHALEPSPDGLRTTRKTVVVDESIDRCDEFVRQLHCDLDSHAWSTDWYHRNPRGGRSPPLE
jgi:hypothetical protein